MFFYLWQLCMTCVVCCFPMSRCLASSVHTEDGSRFYSGCECVCMFYQTSTLIPDRAAMWPQQLTMYISASRPSESISLMAQFNLVGHIWDFLCLLVMFYQLLDVSNDFITAESKQHLIHAISEWLFAITWLDLFWLSPRVGGLIVTGADVSSSLFFLVPLFYSNDPNSLFYLFSFLHSPPSKCHLFFPPPPFHVLLSLPNATITICTIFPLIPPCPNPSFSPSILIKSCLSLIRLQICSLPLLPSIPPLVSL